MFVKKSIFVLEDDPERNQIILNRLSLKYPVVITNSSDLAIDILKRTKFTLLLLDHDLGGRQMVGSGEYDTGFRVAAAIPSTYNKDSAAIIHSYNPTGAQKMFDVLTTKRKVRTPFGRDDFWSAVYDLLKDGKI